jgi:hypothetical protein
MRENENFTLGCPFSLTIDQTLPDLFLRAMMATYPLFELKSLNIICVTPSSSPIVELNERAKIFQGGFGAAADCFITLSMRRKPFSSVFIIQISTLETP